MLVINRLAEVTDDPTVQGASPDDLIRVCGNNDRRNRVARLDKMSVKLKSSHSRHLNVGDQARGCSEEGRFQEIGCRGEHFDSVAQRRHELSHRFAKGLIILDDRDQCTFGHRGFNFLASYHTGAATMDRTRLWLA